MDAPVLFHDHIERCFAYANAGAYLLLSDKPTDSGKWMTRNIQCGRRRGFLIEIFLPTKEPRDEVFRYNTFAGVPYHLKRDLVPAAEVTAVDLLRLLVRKEATYLQARATTRNALNHIVRKSNETISRQQPPG